MSGATWEAAEISTRHAHFLREQAYPGPHKRKRIASDWGVSEALARQWLEGKVPASKHLVRMIARWGAAYLAFVFEPCGQWARELSMIDRIQRAAAEADAIKRDLEKLRTP
jgi:hypothetical protein